MSSSKKRVVDGSSSEFDDGAPSKKLREDIPGPPWIPYGSREFDVGALSKKFDVGAPSKKLDVSRSSSSSDSDVGPASPLRSADVGADSNYFFGKKIGHIPVPPGIPPGFLRPLTALAARAFEAVPCGNPQSKQLSQPPLALFDVGCPPNNFCSRSVPRPVVPPGFEALPSGKSDLTDFWISAGLDVNSDRVDTAGYSYGGIERLLSSGIERVRVHPKFLHSNATSHTWAHGAFAELVDNSIDEIPSGATYVNIDVLENEKDHTRMLLIQDNGGGMDPDKLRRCMSLGYSAKRGAKTIGQYGNGFKTSTMRLGADAIVFSRCMGKHRESSTQSIGLLSSTFLEKCGIDDVIVPMLDFRRCGGDWSRMEELHCSERWKCNMELITKWSPFSTEKELLQQFGTIKEHGTRIIIFNLWKDNVGLPLLNFDADEHDIQLACSKSEDVQIAKAKKFPNSHLFLTYKSSLRSYVSMLYLRPASGFRIILRGKDVEQHNIVNDMNWPEHNTYRPNSNSDGIPKEKMVAHVTIGFVKDANERLDVQGFNVYHKNRLIKPFWRVQNPTSSQCRGVLGLLEADFIEPSHDKQGFEETNIVQKLKDKLKKLQRDYWRKYCDRIGYKKPETCRRSGRGAAPPSSCRAVFEWSDDDGNEKSGNSSSDEAFTNNKSEIAQLKLENAELRKSLTDDRQRCHTLERQGACSPEVYLAKDGTKLRILERKGIRL